MFATMYLPQVIRRMVLKYPNLRMNIMEGSTGHVHERLASGDVDVAVLVVPPKTPKIVAKKILEEPLVLIVRSDHAMAGRKSVVREDVRDLELVLPASAHGSRKRIDEYFEETDIHLDIKINADSLAVTKALVCESDLYCTILPPRACEQEIAAGQLISIPFTPSLQRSVFIARSRDQGLSPYTMDVMQEIEMAVCDGHGHRSAKS
jgi:DNA-binding transcriptional LysR family regulator